MTNDEVAQRWRDGKPAASISMHTDGERLFSYRHEIGRTEDGDKVAVCCHRSRTTQSNHLSAAKRAATAITECPEHSRPQCPVYRATVRS